MTTENTAIVIADKPNAIIHMSTRELSEVAAILFNSKVFGDLQTKDAAAVKIMAGAEKGFTPFQSMSMFDFIQGRPTLNAHGKATLINSSGDFRMNVKELTAKACVIDVCRKNDAGEWKVISTRSFTWQDAVDAGYTTGKNAHSYKNTPRNMLFARNVSNIFRWDCPELNVRRFNQSQISEFSAPELEDDAPVPEAENLPDVSDFVEGEVIDGEYADPEVDGLDSNAENLRSHVSELLSQFESSRQRDILASRPTVAKMNYDELSDLNDTLAGLAA